MSNAARDQNRVPTLIGVSSVDGTTPTLVYVDPTTHRLKVDLASSGQMTLLKANSGTDTNAAATNVDTIALTGLTAKDTLLVYVCFESATQATAAPLLYNNTDGVTIVNILSATVPLDGQAISQISVRQLQSANTLIASNAVGFRANASAPSGGFATFVTAWTGSWTLALRHGGVTAGGTFKWSWSVFKIAGQ